MTNDIDIGDIVIVSGRVAGVEYEYGGETMFEDVVAVRLESGSFVFPTDIVAHVPVSNASATMDLANATIASMKHEIEHMKAALLKSEAQVVELKRNHFHEQIQSKLAEWTANNQQRKGEAGE